MTRLGLRHNENIPLSRQLTDFVGFRSRNVNATSAGVVGMVHVQHFVIETHQCDLRDRKQAYRDVKIGKPERRLSEPLEVLDIMLDLLASTDAPEAADQAYGVIGLDHSLPHGMKYLR